MIRRTAAQNSDLLAALLPPLVQSRLRRGKRNSRHLLRCRFTTSCIDPLLVQVHELRRQRQHRRIFSLYCRARSIETAASLAAELIHGDSVEVLEIETVRVATPARARETLGRNWHNNVGKPSGAASGYPGPLAVKYTVYVAH